MATGAAPTFISYSREDSEFALRLARNLKDSGAAVWLDKIDLIPGQHWDSAVEKALRDCPCVLVILSPSSVTNKNVMDEVSFALDEEKSVIPVLCLDCRIPFRLRRLQYVDFRTDHESGLRELLKALGVEQRAAPPKVLPPPARVPERFWRHRVAIGAAVVTLVFAAAVALYLPGTRKLNKQSKLPPAAPAAEVALSPASVGEKVNPTDGLRYVSIPPDAFDMGCSPSDRECSDDEKPSHRVTISKGFWMGRTEVTVAAYRKFAQAKSQALPSGQDDHPVTNVSWDDAAAYCKAAGGRLPTEAEWEYAARGASPEARYGDLNHIAWYWSNSSRSTHPVAQKTPNKFGLYDMLGNVWEWCSDWYDSYYYQEPGNRNDPKGPEKGIYRVVRGGSWNSYPRSVARASNRVNRVLPGDRVDDDVGFRCVREVIP